MSRFLIPCFLLNCFINIGLFAQQHPRYWDDVQAIKKYDQIYAPQMNPIVFIGSSSIRKWDGLETVFCDYAVLNRGIGGAVINDTRFYLNDLLFKYRPRQVVIYVGENDLTDEASTPDSILYRTTALIKTIRDSVPGISIIYISIKPSPVREKYISKAVAANQLISNFLQTQTNMVYVDVFKPMLTPNGATRPELFVQDQLHMNQQGYAIWRKAVQPYLLKQ